MSEEDERSRESGVTECGLEEGGSAGRRQKRYNVEQSGRANREGVR